MAYKVWHSNVKPPVILQTLRELDIYIQLQRTVAKTTPRWEEYDIDDTCSKDT